MRILDGVTLMKFDLLLLLSLIGKLRTVRNAQTSNTREQQEYLLYSTNQQALIEHNISKYYLF